MIRLSQVSKHAGFLLTLALLLACTNHAAAGPNTNQMRVLPGGTRIYTNLYYVPNGMERQNLDLYIPARGTNFPVVIWIHGGGWISNSKEGPGGQSFLGRGYALASLNYRQSRHAHWPAQLIDCKAAVRWLRAHAADYGLDPDHFGAYGMSSGGHMVAILGTSGDAREFDQGDNLGYSSRLQAVADWFGPTDFLSVSNQSVANWFGPTTSLSVPSAPAKNMRWSGHGDVDTQLLGGSPFENIELAKSASPVHFVSSNSPPFIIMQGEKDPMVPLQQSLELADALQNAGVPLEFHVVIGGGHGSPKAAFEGPEAQRWLHDFFDKYLKPGTASGKTDGAK